MTTRRGTARRPAPRGGGPRRLTTWIDTIVNSAVTTGTQERIDMMGTFDVDERRGMTVMRLLLCLYLAPNPLGAVNGIVVMNMGIEVVSQEGFGAGVVPDPGSATEFPLRGWLYRCQHAVLDDPTPGYPTPVIREDLHAMRRLDTGSVIMVLDAATVQGTAFNIRVMGLMRMLVKLA